MEDPQPNGEQPEQESGPRSKCRKQPPTRFKQSGLVPSRPSSRKRSAAPNPRECAQLIARYGNLRFKRIGLAKALTAKSQPMRSAAVEFLHANFSRQTALAIMAHITTVTPENILEAWKAADLAFPALLPPEFATLYSTLKKQQHRETYRICLTLANSKPEATQRAPGSFFLSSHDLAKRLHTHQRQALRHINALVSRKLILRLKKGSQNPTGIRTASAYCICS